MKTRDYDSTVARIAGNIASGLVGEIDWRKAWAKGRSASEQTIVTISVELARAIVAETKRTEPSGD